VVYRESPPSVLSSDWENLGRVRAAIRELEMGRFQAAADLVDAMSQDDRIAGVMSARLDALQGLEFEFEPPEGLEDNARAKEVAQEARADWTKMIPEAAQLELRSWGLWLGVGIGQLQWDRGPERWTPRLQVWHPRAVTWNSELERYEVATQGGTVPVTAGDGTWVLYMPYGDRRGWMRSLVRSLAVPWLLRQWARRDWARHSEAYGQPSKKAKVPPTATREEKTRFLREVAALAVESTILCEQAKTKDAPSWDVEYLQVAAESHKVFADLKAALEVDIAIRVKGENLTSEVQGGSLAAAEVHRGVAREKLRFDAQTATTCLHDHVLEPWAAFNFGSPEVAPWPCYETEPPEDLQSAATTIDKVGDATGKLWDAGYPLDLQQMAERFDIPLQDGAKVPTERPKPDPAPILVPGAPPAGKRAPIQASRGRVPIPPGAIAGQSYCDSLVEQSIPRAAEFVAPLVGELLRLVNETKEVNGEVDYETLRKRVLDTYSERDSGQLAGLIADAMVLADLNARLSVLDDAPEVKAD
jgi:phage gp29-like protein